MNHFIDGENELRRSESEDDAKKADKIITS